jgi:hypothetical protein
MTLSHYPAGVGRCIRPDPHIRDYLQPRLITTDGRVHEAGGWDHVGIIMGGWSA